jgi:hypothetical protein
MKQLHDHIAFRPVDVNDLTTKETQQALESLIFWWKSVTAKLKAVHVRT